MAILYVANCTKQNVEFHFRVAEVMRPMPFMFPIPIGECRMIYKEETRDVLKSIVEQHRQYGMVHVSEIDRTKPFIGLCYDFDKKIDPNRIIEVLSHNNDVLEERGAELRKIAAVAISEVVDKQQQEMGRPVPAMVSTQVEQVDANDGKDTDLNEVVKVQKEGKKAKR